MEMQRALPVLADRHWRSTRWAWPASGRSSRSARHRQQARQPARAPARSRSARGSFGRARSRGASATTSGDSLLTVTLDPSALSAQCAEWLGLLTMERCQAPVLHPSQCTRTSSLASYKKRGWSLRTQVLARPTAAAAAAVARADARRDRRGGAADAALPLGSHRAVCSV